MKILRRLLSHTIRVSSAFASSLGQKPKRLLAFGLLAIAIPAISAVGLEMVGVVDLNRNQTDAHQTDNVASEKPFTTDKAGVAAQTTSTPQDAPPQQNTLPPYDPRSTGPLQPSPDKPSVPKTQKSLVLNPSSVTIYKNVNGAQGVKGEGVTEVSIGVSTGDGRALHYPTSTGSVLLTASNFNPRANWTMELSSSYASVGTIDIPLSAIAVDGSANFVGTLHVTVLPLPSFTVTPNIYYDMSHGLSDGNYRFGRFNYSDNFNGAYKPNISVTNAGGLACESYFVFANEEVQCGTLHPLPTGMYQPTIVFENKFQKLTFQTQITVLAY